MRVGKYVNVDILLTHKWYTYYSSMLYVLIMVHGKNQSIILKKENVESGKICLMFQ